MLNKLQLSSEYGNPNDLNDDDTNLGCIVVAVVIVIIYSFYRIYTLL